MQRSPATFLLRLLPIALLLALLAAAGCAKRGETEFAPIQRYATGDSLEGFEFPYQPPVGQGVRGYNEPFPESYSGLIGIRAVTWDRWLAISIRNLGADNLMLEPAAFRLLMPDRSLYEIGQERHRMSLFAPMELLPGDNTVLIARIPELDNLDALQVIFNYPPREVILRTRIERAAETAASGASAPSAAPF